MDRSTIGEILRRVIDHLVGAERSHEVCVGAAAHGGNVRTEVLRQLHGEHAEAARSPMHENPFARLHVRPAQEVQGARRADEYGAGLFERHGNGLTREEPVLRHARKLRVGGELIAARAVHRIARREPLHTRSDAFNNAGEIDTQNRVLGSKPA